jgi:hypothetical protein
MSSTVERQGEREKRGEIKQHRLRLNLKEATELCIINLIKRAFVKRRKILYGSHEETFSYVENERGADKQHNSIN